MRTCIRGIYIILRSSTYISAESQFCRTYLNNLDYTSHHELGVGLDSPSLIRILSSRELSISLDLPTADILVLSVALC